MNPRSRHHPRSPGLRRGMRRLALPAAGAFLLLGALASGCGEEELPEPPEAEEETPALPPDEPAPEPEPEPAPPEEAHPEPPADPPEADPEADVQTAEGVVGVTGTDAWSIAVLRTDDGRSLGLAGPLEDELRRLSGIRIRVEGRAAGTAVGPGLEVEAYELLDVEGRTPHLGILDRGEDGAWVLQRDEEEPLSVVGLPDDRVREGMKIWVVGRTGDDGRFRVESYGVVAPAPS